MRRTWLYLLFLMACGNDTTYHLIELFDHRFYPHPKNYKLVVEVKGEFPCPFEIILQKDGKDYESIILTGKVDSLIYNYDWYGGDLTFKTTTPGCMDALGEAKVEFCYFN